MREQLSAKEKQIVDLLLLGYENPEIAKKLNMSESAVKKYFSKMFRHFGIKSGIKRVKLAVLLERDLLCEEIYTGVHSLIQNKEGS